VHVYDVPNPRPYTQEEVETTRRLLPDHPVELTPAVTEQWVEEAHWAHDEDAMREGWAVRRVKCSDVIRQRVQGKENAGVAELIRGGSDTVRLAICSDPSGVRPGAIQTISVYRNQLLSARESAGQQGWMYSPDSERLWEPLADLRDAYLVAVPPSMARYTPEAGLVLGQSGELESPLRQEPPRPGYSPLKRESWLKHAEGVAAEAERRLVQDAFGGGLLAMLSDSLMELVRWSALLHDLGKLQKRWQEWAEQCERARDPGYKHAELLAHTNYDSSSAEDRAVERSVQPRRPKHSAASTWYGYNLLPQWTLAQKTAVLAAVLSHHGGWSLNDIEALHPRWQEAWNREAPRLRPPTPAQRDSLAKGLMPADRRFYDWWSLAGYLMRTLRLSDQRATEDTTYG
jgi:CRISPR-associated endonuclease Cas3-HD